MADYAIHPVAEMFPMMSDEEVRALAEDIAKNVEFAAATMYNVRGKPRSPLAWANR